MRNAPVPLAGTAVPAAWNTALLALVAGANVFCAVLLPLALPPQGSLWLLLLVPFVLFTVPHWALIHEAIHGHLYTNRRASDLLGRGLAVLFTAPFDALKVGHLSHHSFNSRPSERAEIYDPARTPPALAWPLYYFRLFIRLYAAEALSVVLCFLPRAVLAPLVRRVFYEGSTDAAAMAARAERQLLDPKVLLAMRRESALALLWAGLALWLYGGWAWAFALALLGRGVVVSFMDNAPHYAGELDEPGQGFDMTAPPALAPLILNTNFHGTHHRHPNLPWTALPLAFAADGRRFAGPYLAMPLRQLKGPIPVSGALPAEEATAAG